MTKQMKSSTGIEQIPEGYKLEYGYVIPKEWKIVRFDKCFHRLTQKNAENNQNVLTISAQQGLISQLDYYNTLYASEDKTGYFLLQKGDFAYNKSYSTDYAYGAIKQLEKYEKGIVSPLYICFSANRDTNADFYRQYFEAGRFNREIYKIAQEGARNHGLLNVSTPEFFSAALVYPPVAEQKKIAEILAQCDKVIELYQCKIDELKKLKKACLNMVFPEKGSTIHQIRFPGFKGPWKKYQLGEISTFITKGTTPTTYGFSWQNDGIPFFRNDCIRNNIFVYGDFSYISEDANEALQRSEIQGNDILIAITGDIGKVGIVPESIKKANINQHIARIRTKSIEPYFVYQYLASDVIQNDYKKIKTGISMPQLSLEQIRETTISVPSTAEQRRIAAFLKEFDNLISLNQQTLGQWKQKKKFLMQTLLTGIVRIKC